MRNCGSPSIGNPPSARAFLIASTLVFSLVNVTIAVWFLGSVSTLETPSIPFRIEPTLSAVFAHTHPGTVSFTFFSVASEDWQAMKTKKADSKTTNITLLFPITSSFLLSSYCQNEATESYLNINRLDDFISPPLCVLCG